MSATATHSLFELNEYLRRVLALNFPESLWIRAEVAQLGLNRGIHYVELVEKGEESDEVVAKSSAVVWKNDWEEIRRQVGPVLDELWQEGVELRLRVWVEFHERYGLRLLIKEIDPAFTLGQLELERRAVLLKLKSAGLLEKNKLRKLPPAVQRVAVVTAQTAAGWQDFRQQLAENQAGFRFHLTVFNAAVQGKNAEADLVEALEKIATRAADFDCAAILRGGGLRLDLAAFDRLEVCKKVAACPLPVITGIGHDIDESVADLVAFSAQKTPTAAADFLINHNLLFEEEIEETASHIAAEVFQKLQFENLRLDRAGRELQWKSSQILSKTAENLRFWEASLPDLIARLIDRQRTFLGNAASLTASLDPQRLLARGFSMTFLGDKLVKSAASVQPGEELRTVVADGEIHSKTAG